MSYDFINVGDTEGLFYVGDIKARTLERTMPAMTLLMPYFDMTGIFGWSSKEVLVSTPAKNYTVNEYHRLFRDMNFIDGYHMWLNGAKIIPSLPAPGVEIVCIHGNGFPTPGIIKYKTEKDFPDGDPDIVKDDGDGTVNLRSLQACLKFKAMQINKFTYHVLNKQSHMEILRSTAFLDYVKAYISNL